MHVVCSVWNVLNVLLCFPLVGLRWHQRRGREEAAGGWLPHRGECCLHSKEGAAHHQGDQRGKGRQDHGTVYTSSLSQGVHTHLLLKTQYSYLFIKIVSFSLSFFKKNSIFEESDKNFFIFKYVKLSICLLMKFFKI